MEKILRYENGIRAVVETLPLHSVSIGIWTNAGAAKETAENNGISHFIEHMIFKGTPRFNAYEIAKNFEDLGAAVNAFTGKDCTCYYVKTVSDFTEKCFDYLSHIFLESSFPDKEIERERNVVIEEINMTEDSPEDVCFNILADSMFDGPLSQTILGPVENLQRFNKDDIKSYMGDNYCPQNTVIAFAGNIAPAQADKLIKTYFLPKISIHTGINARKPNNYASKQTVKIDDYEQSNLCIGFPSIIFNDKLTSVQSLLSVIMGGSMSSRLFQKVREQMGLAYSIYTTPSVYVNAGSFNICVNYTACNTQKVLYAVKKEVSELIKNGVTGEEFERAKAQVKAAMVFSQENMQSQMLAFGKMLLLCDKLYDIGAKLKEIDAVTVANVNDFAKNVFSHKPALAYLGKEPDVAPLWE